MRDGRQFLVLEGLRGTAALLVAIRHGGDYFGEALPKSYLAVDFFFVLSGFILAHAYSERIHSGLSTREFLVARLVRLYPLYLLGLVLSALAPLLMPHHPGDGYAAQRLVQFIYGALLIPMLAAPSADVFPLNAPSWSIFFELVANLFLPFVLRNLRPRAQAALALAFALTLALAALTGTLGFGFAKDSGLFDKGVETGSFLAGFPRVFFAFFCGVAIHALRPRSRGPAGLVALATVPALVALLSLPVARDFDAIYDLAAVLVLFPLLVFAGTEGACPRPLERLFGFLGATSYGLYILQFPLYELAYRLWRTAAGHPPAGVAAGVAILASMLVLVRALDAFYDRPVRAWLTRTLAARCSPRAAAPMPAI